MTLLITIKRNVNASDRLAAVILRITILALLAAGANLGADVSQLNNLVTGFDAIEGVVSMSSCKIDNCTRGVRAKEIEGQIIGAATFTNNVNDIVKITSTNDTAFYRTGTWTPVLSDVTATYSIQNGEYVIIGNIVHCRVRLLATVLDNLDTSSVKITGLPFAEDGAVYLSTNISVSPKNSTLLKSATSDVYINGYFSGGSIILSKGASDMLYTDMNASGYLYMSIIYHSAII